MHPAVLLTATMLGGAAVVGGAYVATTTALQTSAAPSGDGRVAVAATDGFLVAVCADRATLVRVLDARCDALLRGDVPTGPVGWRYLPSSFTNPTVVPPVGASVIGGSFTDTPDLPRFTEAALGPDGLPPVQDRSAPARTLTPRG